MAASADPQQLSPKFTWPLIVGFAVFAGGEALSLVTVEAFNFAGEAWAGVLHKFVTVAAMCVTAYYKMDPLRQNFASQVEAERNREASEDPAVNTLVEQGEYEGKHVATPIVYDPPNNLAG